MAKRGNELGMAVALEHLVGNGRGFESQFTAGYLFYLRGYGGISADRPGNLTDGNDFLGFVKAVEVAPHFLHPDSQLQTERDRFGMDAVGTA